jgi:hypothetical protein
MQPTTTYEPTVTVQTPAEIQAFQDEFVITRQALLQLADPDIRIRDMDPSGLFFLVENGNMMAYVGHPNDTSVSGNVINDDEGIARVYVFDDETDGALVDQLCTIMEELVIALDMMGKNMSGRSTPHST